MLTARRPGGVTGLAGKAATIAVSMSRAGAGRPSRSRVLSALASTSRSRHHYPVARHSPASSFPPQSTGSGAAHAGLGPE